MVKQTLYIIIKRNNLNLILLRSNLEQDLNLCVKGIENKPNLNITGYAHMAFSVGSEERVNELTKVIKDAGYPLLNGPRFTGDGYYESVIGASGR